MLDGKMEKRRGEWVRAREKDKKAIIISWYIINQCAHSLHIIKHINKKYPTFLFFSKRFSSIIVNAIN